MIRKAIVVWLLGVAAVFAAPDLSRIEVEPPEFLLSAIPASQRLIVSGHYSDGSVVDVTAQATFTTTQSAVIDVDEKGWVHAKGDGPAYVVVKHGELSALAIGRVKARREQRPFSFEADIAPIFSQRGCNSFQCHGSLNGKNGFHLSVFGYDPAADYRAVVEESGGRRINLNEAEKSLVLMKPTFQIAHEGGLRFGKDSENYQLILNWLEAGGSKGASAPSLVELRVYPQREIVLSDAEQTQQVVVVGRYADGAETDLTKQVSYKPNDDSVAEVSEAGVVSGKRSGETAIMVRSLGVVNVLRVAVALRPELTDYRRPSSENFVDDLILEKLERLRIRPSNLSTDEEFVRRVYLDLIGTLPTAEEARGFLADRSPDKRRKVIDHLFERVEYADFWSLKWGDQLTNSIEFLQNATPYYQMWLRKALRENMAYDEFARQLLTSAGHRYEVAPTNYFSEEKCCRPLDLLDMTTFTAQTFLGLSLECARCHDHPSEKWKRNDYLGLAAFLAQVKEGKRDSIYIDLKRELKHPDTGEVVPAKFPGEDEPLTFGKEEDRRERFAAWLTARDNPYFAPTIVNRVWKQLMGRGLVEPEDFRITNPSSHPELLAKLSEDFIEHGFNLRHLMRRILTSRTYQLSSRVNETNRDDETAYSHYYSRRLTAEQLLDAIAQATEIPEQYPAFPLGKRAIQLPDEQVESFFLETFDRPLRTTPTCERKAAPKMLQAMHLVSGETINKRLRSDDGRLARLLKEGMPDREVTDQLTLATLSRYPTEKEYALADEAVLRAGSRRRGLEDYFWTLLNAKEFLYNH